MMEKAFGRGADNGCLYFPDYYERSAHHHAGHCGRGAYVSRLAKAASCFFLAVCVAMRRNLEKKNEGNQRQAKG